MKIYCSLYMYSDLHIILTMNNMYRDSKSMDSNLRLHHTAGFH